VGAPVPREDLAEEALTPALASPKALLGVGSFREEVSFVWVWPNRL